MKEANFTFTAGKCKRWMGFYFFGVTLSPFHEFSTHRPQSSPKRFSSLFPEVLSGKPRRAALCPAGVRSRLLSPSVPRQAESLQLMICCILQRADSQPRVSPRASCEAWETELCQLFQLCCKPLAMGRWTGTTSIHAAKPPGTPGRICERVSVGPIFQGCPKDTSP